MFTGKVKTTLVIDEKVWNEFRALALSRYGGARTMSIGVEEALRSFSPLAVLRELSAKLKIDGSYPTSREILSSRVRVSTSAGKVVREMRNGRQKSVSRLKQHRKTRR